MRASRGEIKIEDCLNAAGLNFKEEYWFPDLLASSGRPLRFDFVVFDDNDEIDFLIEFQGEQHYKASTKFGGKVGLFRQQFNDNLKVKYCKEHGYTLIVIPYWEEQFIDYDYLMKKAGY